MHSSEIGKAVGNFVEILTDFVIYDRATRLHEKTFSIFNMLHRTYIKRFVISVLSLFLAGVNCYFISFFSFSAGSSAVALYKQADIEK